MLENRQCVLGITYKELEQVLGDRLQEFNKWMAGQTVAACDGWEYNHNERKYEPTHCGPHGIVVYPWDLLRFLDEKPVG